MSLDRGILDSLLFPLFSNSMGARPSLRCRLIALVSLKNSIFIYYVCLLWPRSVPWAAETLNRFSIRRCLCTYETMCWRLPSTLPFYQYSSAILLQKNAPRFCWFIISVELGLEERKHRALMFSKTTRAIKGVARKCWAPRSSLRWRLFLFAVGVNYLDQIWVLPNIQ